MEAKAMNSRHRHITMARAMFLLAGMPSALLRPVFAPTDAPAHVQTPEEIAARRWKAEAKRARKAVKRIRDACKLRV
jgi:hypothetical protein